MKNFLAIYGHFATYEDVTNLLIDDARFYVRIISAIIPFDNVGAALDYTPRANRIVSVGQSMDGENVENANFPCDHPLAFLVAKQNIFAAPIGDRAKFAQPPNPITQTIAINAN